MQPLASAEFPEQACARLAERQLGVFSRAQASELGFSRGQISRRLASGRWLVVFPGVYCFAGARLGWKGRLMAANLWAGETGAVSHRAAARLWRLRGFDSEVIEVTYAAGKNAPDGVVGHKTTGPPPLVTRIGILPVTTPAQTLVDLGGFVPDDELENAMDEMLRSDLITPARLKQALVSRAPNGRGGVRLLKSLLDEMERFGRPESGFERRLFRLLRRRNVPLPRVQFVVRLNGQFVARPDFAYPEFKFAIEAESYQYHSDRRAWRNDVARGNRLTKAGWRVLRVTWRDLTHRPDWVVETILKMLD